MPRPPTMEDVARAAGVSRSTVSRVFQNGGERVSADATVRIHEAAKRLGYVHNLVASGLALRRGRQLGLLIRDATNPAYGHLHAEMNRAVQGVDRQLISVTASRHDYGTAEVEGLNRLIGQRVAGVFVGTGVTAAEDLVETVTATPMMIVGRPNDHPQIESVSYDERTHGRLMADAIAAAGHRRIAVLTAPLLYSRVFDLRMRSLAERCGELGLTTIPVDLLPVEHGVARALDVAREEALSCIVCPVDFVALDLLRAAVARGVRIPEDVSTVGFDGLGDGLDLLGLATVRLPVAEVAREAVTRMEALLVATQEDAEGPPPPGGDQGGVDATARARHLVIPGRFLPGRTLSSAPEHLRT
ncbi:LacI family DNA-binding transcriptional regulator [Brachybacterium saurashtrense]|uniref:LacI family transcriptional regulator n=1 Tax=Brachybacterium saurashtrense TaxID=556288 RepID=A0A345YRC8_9MICO|nr:LacI family DNA-binding transcriptional regulator [Brachybacterium saurashtrense]AXK46480.1 LacI family transcriptional regulator [Brachybacterium saurashtrense]RRR24221.1 LacI family transcriptional regulator [Brachybacterium saurashtrense]